MEVMQAYLTRIHTYNPVYNAIVQMPESDELLQQAAKADDALQKDQYFGWMHGMPHAVKDLADVQGMVTSRGSPLFANKIAQSDAIVTERMRQDGAIFIGKTNVPEFGLGSHTYNRVYGTPKAAFPIAIAITFFNSSGTKARSVARSRIPFDY